MRMSQGNQNAIVHVAAGHIVGATLDTILGKKRELLFLRLKDGKRILAIANSSYYTKYIKSKCRKKKMDEKDFKWTQEILKKTDIKF